MSCVFDEENPSRLISIEFYGYMRSAIFGDDTARFTLAYYGQPSDESELLQIDFEAPDFSETDVHKVVIEETSAIKIKEDRVLFYCGLAEEPHVFEAQNAAMELVKPPTDFYLEWLEFGRKNQSKTNDQLKATQRKLNRVQNFLKKAIDRAERRTEFRPGADKKRELSTHRGALTFLEEE